MSRKYYNRYNKKKNKTKSKIGKVLTKVLVVFLIFGVLSAFVSLLNIGSIFDGLKKDKTEYVDVYLVPGDSWSADGSSYGAWCWNDSGVPAAVFVLATDEDENGIYELKISKEYSSMLFVDLVPGATELGADWKNKREQTNNLTVPDGDKVYYHAYANEWSDKSDVLFTVTIEAVSVVLSNCGQWAIFQSPVVYYFDKTGKNEPQFASMTQCGAHDYIYDIPAGYTHLIFLEYDESGSIGSWDNVLNQTSDLVIPTGEARYYDLITNEWFAPVQE